MTAYAVTSQASSIKFTYEDYLLFPEDGKRHELIDGDRYMTPSPSTKHQRVSMSLSNLFCNYLKGCRGGHIFAAPCDVVLSDLDVVQPDLLFVSAARASLITEQCIQGAPDLVVEILSATTRKTDEIVKRKLYERHGVGEYWIVDPELESVKVVRRSDQSGYARAIEMTLEAGDTISTPLLPDLTISLAELFA